MSILYDVECIPDACRAKPGIVKMKETVKRSVQTLIKRRLKLFRIRILCFCRLVFPVLPFSSEKRSQSFICTCTQSKILRDVLCCWYFNFHFSIRNHPLSIDCNGRLKAEFCVFYLRVKLFVFCSTCSNNTCTYIVRFVFLAGYFKLRYFLLFQV